MTAHLLRMTVAGLAVTLTLAFASAAPAQQPPPGQTPPTQGPDGPRATPPPAAASADLSIQLERDGSTVDEGEHYSYTARVINNGPGTARHVFVIVSTPEEFDLDDTNQEAACETNPFQEGRMLCRFGDLPPGAEVTLHFRGEFRDHGNHKTHVFVGTGTTDPDTSNNADDRRVDVQENEPVEDEDGDGFACQGRPLTLKGGDRPDDNTDSEGDGIEVSSDLEVRLNGETIFLDDNGTQQFAPASMVVGAGPPLGPIEFRARPGDRLQILANTGNAPNTYLDPLFLSCPDQPQQQLTEGVGDNTPGPNTEFFNEEFTIDFALDP